MEPNIRLNFRKPKTAEKTENQDFNPELEKKLGDTLEDEKMVEEAKQKWLDVCKGGFNKQVSNGKK